MLKPDVFENSSFKKSYLLFWSLFLIILGLLGLHNFKSFHYIIETFTIILASIIYVMASKTHKYSNDNYLMFLGHAFLYVAILDFFHKVTYFDYGIISDYDSNLTVQFWIAGRYILSLSMLLAPLVAPRKFNKPLWSLVYIAVTGSFIISIMYLKVFPVCYVEGYGLTKFKIVSEYIVSVIFMFSMILLSWRKEQNTSLYFIIIVALSLMVCTELCFTLYINFVGEVNVIGHLFKAASYYLIYYGIVQRGLQKPYETIFRELKEMSITDALTGIYNRNGFLHFIKREITYASSKQNEIGIMMIDIDNFKKVNDNHGHLAGDRVLREFAQLLSKCCSDNAILFRLGGDEFLILSQGNKKQLEQIKQDIKASVTRWKNLDNTVLDIDISFGEYIWSPKESDDINCLLRKADELMYTEKQMKKQQLKNNPSVNKTDTEVGD